MGLSLRNFKNRIIDQINPLDNNRTWQNPHGNAPPQQVRGRTPPSAFQQLIHSGASNFVGNNVVKPVAQFPIDASNQIYNRVVAPVLHTPNLTPQQVVPISNLSSKVGATGSLHQTVGSGIQTGLTLVGGGLYKGLEAGAAKVLPTTILPKITANAAIGSGFNAAAAAGQGAKPVDIAKSAALGGTLGGAIPIVGAGAKTAAKPIVKLIEQRASKPTEFNSKAYIKQQTEAQRQAAEGSAPSKVVATKQGFRVKAVDALAPIEDPVNAAVGRSAALPLRNALDRSLRSGTIAGQYAQDNGLHDIIKSVPNTKAFDQYVIAKHAQDLEANGIKTGRDLNKDQQLVESLAPKYKAHAQALTDYNHKLLDTATNYGLISRETNAYLKQKYPNYVPMNRVFSESELKNAKGGNGSGPASISTQTVVRKIEGSGRQVESPLESVLAKTHDVIAQGERARAARQIVATKDLPGNPLGLAPLRTAKDVMIRQDAYKQLSELKPARDYLKQAITDTKKQFRGVASRNKRDAAIIDAKVANLTDRVKAALAESNTLTGPKSNKFADFIAKSPTTSSVENLVNVFLHIEDPAFRNQVAKVMTQDLKMGNLAATLQDNASQLDTVMAKRGELFNEARLHADAQAKGLDTISTFNNGIKEIWQTTPEVAAAAKSLNKEQLGFVGQIFAVPTRILRLGATSANAAFALANVAKDTASAFINSEHSLRASVANPNVFVKALAAASHHGGKNYKELVREGAGGTSFDIARNEAKDTLSKVRSRRNVATKTLYTVRHPGELLRAVEDTIGRSEEFNRAVQYYGNKAAAKGKGEAFAKAYGADAARNNTINFARAGEYGRTLNSVLPYLNAGIQGSRTLLRNLKERPTQTTAKIVMTAFLPVATATAWNLNDPKRKAAYDSINDYEKQNNIIIVPPNPKQDDQGRWNVIKIPVSQEIANLNNSVRNGVEALAKDKNFNFAELAGNLTGTVTSLNTQSGNQLVGQITPQAVKPIAETALNKNLFTGQPIVPDALKNLAPQDQISKATSGTARVLGQATGQSPLKIDNAIRTMTGGLGQNVIHETDTALAKAGAIKPDQIKGKSLATAIANRFNSAQGQTPGSLFFSTLQDAAKKSKLAGKDYELLTALTTKTMDASGNAIPQDDKSALNTNQILANNPRVAAVKAAAALALAKKTGKAADPLYSLTPEQQTAFYKLQGSIYKGQAYERLSKENQSWLPAFQKERSAYYDNLHLTDTVTSNKVKYPLNSKEQDILDNYFAITDPAKRAAATEANPAISDAFNKLSKYANDKQIAQGSAPLDTYPSASPQVQQWTKQYFAQPKGSKLKWQRANPGKWQAVSQQLTSQSLYGLEGDAVAAQYKDTGLSQKGLADLYNLGQYDVQKSTDENGNTFYALGTSDPNSSSGGNNYSRYASSSSGGRRYYSRSGSRGGSNSNTSTDPTALTGSPYKYAVSPNAGGKAKRPKVTAHLSGKGTVKTASAAKPKVSIKKSKV